MKRLVLFIFLLSFLSSNAQQSISFENKVFLAGSMTDFNSVKCEFFFECDCCFEDYIFLPDNKFLCIDYCTADYTLTSGTYRVDTENIILNFTNQKTEIDYNWEYDVDQTVQKWIVKDTIKKQIEIKFEIDSCKKTMLVIEVDDYTYIAIESSKSIADIKTKFEKFGLLEHLEKFLK
ncbi:hypothetical protein ACFLSE_08725 [Bacteroidota bacterium]